MTRGTARILVGDCMAELDKLPEKCFHACVTSPPYFGLRSYLPAGHPDKDKELGSEPTPEEFIQALVSALGRVGRVLRDDGFMWVNLGDSYGCDGSQLLMPHRVALALQADGWILRDTIVWAKRSPMPQSVNGGRWERCRVKVKAAKESLSQYGQSGNATAVDHSLDIRNSSRSQWAPCPGCKKCEKTGGWILRRGQGRTCSSHEYLFMFTKTNAYHWDMENCRELTACGKSHSIPRSVWTMSSEPTKYKHFATYPSELVRRCLLPLSKGCCQECGAQLAPMVESERVATRPGLDSKVYDRPPVHEDSPLQTHHGDLCGNRDPGRHVTQNNVVGYRPTCNCDTLSVVPCRVIDPFSGTGTTGQTACFMGHDYVGIELNPDYAQHSTEHIEKEPRWSLRQKKAKPRKRVRVSAKQRSLFA